MIYKETKKSHIYVDSQKRNLQQFIKRRSINYAKNKLERNKEEQRNTEVRLQIPLRKFQKKQHIILLLSSINSSKTETNQEILDLKM